MRYIILASLGFTAISAAPAYAANLLTNGDFSAGLTGYQTQYSGTDATGYQYLATNPRDICGCFASIDGTTNGHGNQLILDGAANGDYFFQETVNIVAGAFYTLSFDAVNLGTAGPQPSLAAYVNGVAVTTTGPLSYNDTYQTYTTAPFTLGALTSATVTLVDLTMDHSYNDFAVDNVAFTGPAPAAAVPETASWAMMVGGFGILGGAMRRQRMRVSFS